MIDIKKLTETEIAQRKILDWPIWEKEVSEFPWEYEMDEYCLILDGEVVVSAEGKDFLIKKGDFVKFPKGLKCHWEIKEPIRKHYQFE